MPQVLFPGRRFIDENGNPISGGKLYTYEAGTTTPLDTYINDALTTTAPNPIVLSSAGMMTTNGVDEGPIYVAPDNYRLVLRSSDDATTYFDIDDLTVIDPDTATAVAAETITSNTTVASSDLDRPFLVNSSSGDVTITADSETLGSGFIFHVKKTSSDANSGIVSGTGVQVIDGSATFTLDSQYDSATFISNGAAGWSILAQTLDTSTLVSDNAIQRVQVSLTAGRLEYSSATTIVLKQYKGAYICFPYGTSRLIPSAGVSAVYNNANIDGVAASTLTADTTYYVYAWDNGGEIKIDFSTTGYSFNTSTGIAEKTGDGTRVLVGMVRTNASSQFDDSAVKRNVASWHNRRKRALRNTFTTDRAVASGANQEINSEIRVQLLTWGEDDVEATFNFRVNMAGTGDFATAAPSFNGVEPTEKVGGNTYTGGADIGAAPTDRVTLSEGFHYITAWAFANGGTSTYQSTDCFISAETVI
jgi:hypothetical protein